MKIIAFSGVDGSGKSTQKELTKEYLESAGYKLAYFHATEFSLANRISRKARKEKSFTPGSTPAVTKASFPSILFRIAFLTIDGIRFFFYKIKLKRRHIDYLVTDRFFQDSLINIVYLSKNPLILLKVIFLSWILPKPTRAFYLQLSAEDILKRDRVPEQGMDYLKEKIEIYNNPPFAWSVQVLDATQTPDAIHLSVVESLRDI
jgi:thymidylate kinase